MLVSSYTRLFAAALRRTCTRLAGGFREGTKRREKRKRRKPSKVEARQEEGKTSRTWKTTDEPRRSYRHTVKKRNEKKTVKGRKRESQEERKTEDRECKGTREREREVRATDIVQPRLAWPISRLFFLLSRIFAGAHV